METITLRCSSCTKALCEMEFEDIPLTEPQYVSAKCCYCGDASLPQKTENRYALSGASVPADVADGYELVTKLSGWHPHGDNLTVSVVPAIN